MPEWLSRQSQTDRPTDGQPASQPCTHGRMDRWMEPLGRDEMHICLVVESQEVRDEGENTSCGKDGGIRSLKKKKKMEVCVEKSGAQRKPWVVCVRTTRRCDGRYLRSAWSSQTAYLSKASRPGLGPP